MGDDSAGEGPSNIRNLKTLIKEAKCKFNDMNVNDNRWPCPFCFSKSKTEIQCRIHIKNEHPSIYNLNEAQLFQLTQVDSQTHSEEIHNESNENGPNDLNDLLKIISEEEVTPSKNKDQYTHREENLKNCMHCPPNLSQKTYKGIRGLKAHHSKKHKEIEFSYFEGGIDIDNITIDSIVNKLSILSMNVKIIKRISNYSFNRIKQIN